MKWFKPVKQIKKFFNKVDGYFKKVDAYLNKIKEAIKSEFTHKVRIQTIKYSPETHDVVVAKVVEMISDELNIPKSQVVPEADLIEDLGGDSLDVADLVVKFEYVFDLVINDDTAAEIVTVQDFLDYIKNQTKEDPPEEEQTQENQTEK
jgi:acyl carrier protein